jgi:hypothetical protein
MPQRSYLPWNVESDLELRELAAKGLNLRRLALRLRRSESSIKKRVYTLEIQVKAAPRFRFR